MRTGLILSGTAHAAILAWGVFSLAWPAPLDSSNIEQIPVDFVELADDTVMTKGLQTAALVEDVPPLPPAAKAVEEPPPLPLPEPPKPEPPPPTPPPPTPPPAPVLPPPPPPVAQAEEPPPAAAPSPDADAPPPEETAAAPLKDVPMPRVRPKMPVKPDPSVSDIDQITALLDRRKLDEMTAEQPSETPATAGTPTAPTNVKMTVNDLELLRARLARCWSPPLGWTDPAEVRVVLLLSLNADGSVSGRPQVLESPQGQYANAAPESAIRAVLHCAPYNLPPDKYDAWKEVKVTFDPRDMGAG